MTFDAYISGYLGMHKPIKNIKFQKLKQTFIFFLCHKTFAE